MSFFALSLNGQTVIFDPCIWPYQLLPLQARVDLAAMSRKEYSSFSKAPEMKPHYQIG